VAFLFSESLFSLEVLDIGIDNVEKHGSGAVIPLARVCLLQTGLRRVSILKKLYIYVPLKTYL